MRVSGILLVMCLLLCVKYGVGDECPFTCSTDSDCQWVEQNVGASQACQDGCCGPAPGDFQMEGDATSGIAARCMIAVIPLLAFLAA